MEILQLTYFCHAASSENFSKTAEHFNVPTSNISRAVRSLERELGVKFFKRSANKIMLSEEGEIFYRYVKEALSSLEKGKNELSEQPKSLKSEIKILISTCRRLVTEAIETCKKQYPEMRFLVKHGVEDGNYDFVISDIPPENKKTDKVHLMTERMLIAVPKSSKLYKSKNIAQQIDKENFISLGKGTRLHALTAQYCNYLGFHPNIAIQTDDPHYVRKYLEMGLGIAIVPERSWANLLPPEIKLIDMDLPLRKNYVFTEKDTKLNNAQKAFLEILIKSFK